MVALFRGFCDLGFDTVFDFDFDFDLDLDVGFISVLPFWIESVFVGSLDFDFNFDFDWDSDDDDEE